MTHTSHLDSCHEGHDQLWVNDPFKVQVPLGLEMWDCPTPFGLRLEEASRMKHLQETYSADALISP